MITVKDFKVSAEGDFETLMLDVTCILHGVKDILRKSYGMSEEDIKGVIKKSFETDVEIAVYKEENLDE